MRRILLAASGTLAAVVAVFLYPTSTNQSVVAEGSTATVASTTTGTTDSSSASATTEPSASATTDSSTATGSATDSSGGTSDTAAASAMADGTYSGTSTMRYGTVTVTITVADGQITDASGTQSSNDAKSQMIASQAMPTLDSEAVAAQSASIAMVSHATFTSSAYEQSLQSAIDQAFGA